MGNKRERSEEAGKGDLYHNKRVLRHPSVKRAREIDGNPPLQELEALLDEMDSSHDAKAVLHWFRSKDLRQEDNKALAAASKKARDADVPLITMFLYSPKDLEWHGTSPARSDFMFRCLKVLQDQLRDKSIPLTIITVSERSEKTSQILDFVMKQGVTHIYANFEYEVDELRRDIDLAKKVVDADKVVFEMFHDQTVVVPGQIKARGGEPKKVFTPYYQAWKTEVTKNPQYLDLADAPTENNKEVKISHKSLFESPIPELPSDKRFASDEEKDRIRKLWPEGHDAAMRRLDEFLEKKVNDYKIHRSRPDLDPSSRLSPYISSGIVSVRQLLARSRDWNGGNNDFGAGAGNQGLAKWVRELVFREFYRQMAVIKPHGSMNLPQNLKYDNVKWEDDEDGWKKWCEGRTGVPFIDAGMRQINHEAYMHNRLRMNVSSYLTSNLLLDYRLGERYFVEHLVDWDLYNNTNGWEPSYTIFNPVIQAEKCDPKGDYIRRWVPELASVKGKAIFAPWDRLSEEEFNKLGYPRPHVDYMESRHRARARFKRDMAEADA